MLQRLHKMKLSNQLNIGFGAVLVLLAIISLFSYIGLNTGYSNFKEYRGLARDTNLAGLLRANMLLVQLNAQKYKRTSTPEVLKKYNARVVKLEAYLETAETEITDPERAENIAQSSVLIKDYKSSFQQVVKLIALRHEMITSSLNPSGVAMRQTLTDMAKYGNQIGFDGDQSYQITKAIEAVLLGRLYVVKYLVTNSEADYARAKKELGSNLIDERQQLSQLFVTTKGRELLKQFNMNYDQYLSALDQVYAIIEQRNKLMSSMNKMGSVVANKIENVQLSVKKEQDILGPKAQKNSRSTVTQIIWVSLISIIIGLIIARLLTTVIRKPIGGEPKDIAALVLSISNGNLIHTFKNSQNATGIYHSVVQMTAKLKEMISNIANLGENISKEAGTVFTVSEKASQTAVAQQQQTSVIIDSIGEMNRSIEDIVQHANDSVRVAKEAMEKSTESKVIVDDTISSIQNLANSVDGSVDSMNSLENNSNAIGKVIEVIQGISEQTNLLALNAAIEAARAGEHGRGFAVVADEVRGLAQRTKDSTGEIQNMIQLLQADTEKAVKMLDVSRKEAHTTVEKSVSTGEALDSILESISMISDMSIQVSSSVDKQSLVVKEINSNVDAIGVSSDNMAGDANNTAKVSQKLSGQAEELKALVASFKIK